MKMILPKIYQFEPHILNIRKTKIQVLSTAAKGQATISEILSNQLKGPALFS